MKIKVGVIFGGKSVEHEISVITANQGINAIDIEKYEIMIDITNEIVHTICEQCFEVNIWIKRTINCKKTLSKKRIKR